MWKFLLGNWKVFGAIALLAFSAGSYAGFKVRSAGVAIEKAAEFKDILDKQKTDHDKSVRVETELAGLRTNNRLLNTLLDNELKNPAYDCPVPSFGVQNYNDSLAGKAR